MIKPSEKLKAMMDFESNDNTIKFLGDSTRNPREANVFKMECIVGIDIGSADARDVKAVCVGFIDKDKIFYVLNTFDNTTKIGAAMIRKLEEMQKESKQ